MPVGGTNQGQAESTFFVTQCSLGETGSLQVGWRFWLFFYLLWHCCPFYVQLYDFTTSSQYGYIQNSKHGIDGVQRPDYWKDINTELFSLYIMIKDTPGLADCLQMKIQMQVNWVERSTRPGLRWSRPPWKGEISNKLWALSQSGRDIWVWYHPNWCNYRRWLVI